MALKYMQWYQGLHGSTRRFGNKSVKQTTNTNNPTVFAYYHII